MFASTLLGIFVSLGYIYLNYLMVNDEVDILLRKALVAIESWCGIGDQRTEGIDLSGSRSHHDLLGASNPSRSKHDEVTGKKESVV